MPNHCRLPAQIPPEERPVCIYRRKEPSCFFKGGRKAAHRCFGAPLCVVPLCVVRLCVVRLCVVCVVPLCVVCVVCGVCGGWGALVGVVLGPLCVVHVRRVG